MGNFFRALRWNNQYQCLFVDKRVRKAHIDGYKFEKAILGHYGDYHLVASIAVVVEEGKAPRMSLNEKASGLIE